MTSPVRIGGFTLLEALGSGGYGEVHRARQDRLKRMVALKTLRSSVLREENVLRRFHREMKLMATLEHPNLVRIFDGGLSDDQAYIAMELVDGPNLDELLRTCGALPWRMAVAIGSRIACGLAHLHERAILHRDIKPSNVMISREGVVKLLDFGLARAANSTVLTAQSHFMGTYLYTAPEIFADGEASEQSDLWALGCVIYLLVTGRHAFEGNTPDQLVHKIFNVPIEDPRALRPDLPQRVSSAVLDLLERELEDRPAEARSVQETLDGILAETGQTSWDAVLTPEALAQLRERGDRAPWEIAAGSTSTHARRMPGITRSLRTPEAGPEAPRTRTRLRWAVSGAALLLMVAAGLMALRSSSRPVPGLEILSSSVRTAWTLEIHTRGVLPAGGEIRLVSEGRVRARTAVIEDSGRATMRVPAGIEGTLRIVHPGGPVTELPGTISTPPQLELRDFDCLPMNDRVLVDFEPSPPMEVSVEISKEPHRSGSDPMLSFVHRAGDSRFHRVMTGLLPGEVYYLRIHSPRAWGGVRNFRFETLPASHEKEMKKVLSSPGGLPEEFQLSELSLVSPDTRLADHLLWMLSRSSLQYNVWLSETSHHLLSLRDPDIARRVREIVDGAKVIGDRARMVRVLADARHPDAVNLADTYFHESETRDMLNNYSRALVLRPGAQSLRMLAGAIHGEGAATPFLTEQLVRCDPDGVREVLDAWRRALAPDASGLAQVIAMGLRLTTRTRDLAGLGEAWERSTSSLERAVLIEPLILHDPEAAGELVLRRLAADPADLVHIWAAARLDLRDARPILRDTILNAAPRVRADVLTVLALLEDRTLLETYRQLLEDEHPSIRRTAAWALAHLHDRSSARALIAMARSDLDTEGMAALALGILGIDEAREVLANVFDRERSQWPGGDPRRLGALAWALGALGNRSVQDSLQRLRRDSRLLPYLQWCAGEGLRMLEAGGRHPDDLLLFPFVLYQPLNRTLDPGDAVWIEAGGHWGVTHETKVMRPPEEAVPSPEKAVDMNLSIMIGVQTVPITRARQNLVATRGGALVATPYTLPPLEPAMFPGLAASGFCRIRLVTPTGR